MSRVITVGAGIKSGDYADAGDSATLKYVWNMKWVIVKSTFEVTSNRHSKTGRIFWHASYNNWIHLKFWFWETKISTRLPW